MVWASAYLIMQVADYSGGTTAEDITRGLKGARGLGDPLAYTHTRFVKIGNTDTVFGAWQGDVCIGNDWPDGTVHSGCEVNGIAKFNNDDTGIGFCMCKDTAYDSPVGQAQFWYVPFGGSLDVNWVNHVVGADQLWTETKTRDAENYINKVLFMWNIPLFNTYAECQQYFGLVTDYWTSGTDEDLDRVKDYLELHMTGND